MTIYSADKKIKKFTKSISYKRAFGESEFPTWAIPEFVRFQQKYGTSLNPTEYMTRWIKFGLKNWVSRWRRIKLVRPQSKIWYFLMWGREEGQLLYESVNARKTKNFDHSFEHQQAAGLAGVAGRKGKKGVSCRSVQWWVNKGHSVEYAQEQVRRIQSSNTISRYAKKYGDDAEQMFNDRKENWSKQMDTPEIGRSRSGGLWRYIERYGEDEGLKKYAEVREKRNSTFRVGRASKESLVFFEPIIQILVATNTPFFCGIEGNKELYIRADKNSYLYDLAIPSLSLIIEYHGEGFHPNPDWDIHHWNQWLQAFTKRSADECRDGDVRKKQAAEKNGWTVIEVFSSDAGSRSLEIVNEVHSRLCSRAN